MLEVNGDDMGNLIIMKEEGNGQVGVLLGETLAGRKRIRISILEVGMNY
jgi:hypothetical protein